MHGRGAVHYLHLHLASRKERGRKFMEEDRMDGVEGLWMAKERENGWGTVYLRG